VVVRELVASDFTFIALDTEDRLWRWGGDASPSTSSSHVPVPFAELPPIRAVAAGRVSFLAIDRDDRVWSWRHYGALEELTAAPAFARFAGRTQAVSISGHAAHLLDVDGQLWGWGDNQLGEVGHAAPGLDPQHVDEAGCRDASYDYVTTAMVDEPQPILDDVAGVYAASYAYSVFAIRRDGTVWAWGPQTRPSGCATTRRRSRTAAAIRSRRTPTPTTSASRSRSPPGDARGVARSETAQTFRAPGLATQPSRPQRGGMPHFEQAVSAYMTRAVDVVAIDASVDEVTQVLRDRTYSSVPVVDARGSIVGVISRTDLIAAGLHPGAHRRSDAPPIRRAGELMSTGPLVCEPTTSLRAAVRTCLEHEVHRLFVVDRGRLVGVLSTVDLAAACARRRARTTDRRGHDHADRHRGGAQLGRRRDPRCSTSATSPAWWWWRTAGRSACSRNPDALASRGLPDPTPVDQVMDTALICLPIDTRMHRAARVRARLDVRRVIACAGGEAVGVVGGLDFARAIAG
jgi:CBS domain-containing protein